MQHPPWKIANFQNGLCNCSRYSAFYFDPWEFPWIMQLQMVKATACSRYLWNLQSNHATLTLGNFQGWKFPMVHSSYCSHYLTLWIDPFQSFFIIKNEFGLCLTLRNSQVPISMLCCHRHEPTFQIKDKICIIRSTLGNFQGSPEGIVLSKTIGPRKFPRMFLWYAFEGKHLLAI